MSADNWAVCPKCVKEAHDAQHQALARVMESYGQIPVEDFDAARNAIEAVDPENFRTFREDYEFYGADAGEVVADYSGHCSKCDLGIDFQERRKFWP